jgi:WD40 repeat protein
MVFSPDGRTLATDGEDMVLLWDVATGEPIGDPLAGHTATITHMVFSRDGSTLATASYDATVRLWDVSTQSHRA